jgi:hypothetical protein
MDDEAFYSSLSQCLLGRVRVDISSVEPAKESREEHPVITKETRKRFKSRKSRKPKSRSYRITSRHNPNNHIRAEIHPWELENVLTLSRITRGELQKSLLPGAIHPKLNLSNTKIYCFNGRHRLKVAKDHGDSWWTVDLYTFELQSM